MQVSPKKKVKMAVRLNSDCKKSTRLKPYDVKSTKEKQVKCDSQLPHIQIESPPGCSDDQIRRPSGYADTQIQPPLRCADETQPLGCSDDKIEPLSRCSDNQIQPLVESSDETLGCLDDQIQPPSDEKIQQALGCSDEQIQPRSIQLKEDAPSLITEKSSEVSQCFPCVSARQPYAGLILNGHKTIETRWTPMFKELQNQTVAIHIAQRTWEGQEWIDGLHLRGLSDVQIDCMVSKAETHGRGVIAGLVDVGETWQCIPNENCDKSKRTEWERAALLKPLDEKYLTRLSNPRWLKRPIKSRGQKGMWTVNLPLENV